jgi:hypothetical protein
VRKIRFMALSLLLCAFSASGTGIITWGLASLSDNNGGAFILGSSTLASGPQYTINLPNFKQSDFDPLNGEVDASITALSAFSTISDIIGVTFTFFGAFTDPGFAQFIDMAGSVSHGPTTFTSSTMVDTINFAPTSHIDISTFLMLFVDNGGSAAISQIRFNIIQQQTSVPEPATIVLLSLGMIAMLWATTRRRRARA